MSSLKLSSEKTPEYHQQYFSCYADHRSRMLRGYMGMALNVLVLIGMGYLTPLLFWSLIFTSYGLLLEGFFGCSILHWVRQRRR